MIKFSPFVSLKMYSAKEAMVEEMQERREHVEQKLDDIEAEGERHGWSVAQCLSFIDSSLRLKITAQKVLARNRAAPRHASIGAISGGVWSTRLLRTKTFMERAISHEY